MSNYTTPTDTQLVNFAAVLVYGPGAPQHVKDQIAYMCNLLPGIKAMWLQRHREFQDAADKAAAQQCSSE